MQSTEERRLPFEEEVGTEALNHDEFGVTLVLGVVEVVHVPKETESTSTTAEGEEYRFAVDECLVFRSSGTCGTVDIVFALPLLLWYTGSFPIPMIMLDFTVVEHFLTVASALDPLKAARLGLTERFIISM